MNKNKHLRNLVKLTAIAFFMSMAIAGCSPKPSEQESVGSTGDETPVLVNDETSSEPSVVFEETPSDEEPICYSPAPGSDKGGNPAVDNEKYEIRLGASQIINIDSDGQMTVRIGPLGSLPEKDSTEVYNSVSVESCDVRDYARVTPRASDFIIDPAEPQIVPVTSSGTAASFSLKPKKLGESSVSAKVEFSSTKDFSKIDEVQWTNTLKVNVIVKSDEREANRQEKIVNRKDELDKTTWDYFRDFWGAFVALFFGALLFVIRKFIKKKTGYGEIPGETPKQEIPSTPEILTEETPPTIEKIEVDEEVEEVIEPETPSAEVKEVSESDDEDDYDD